MIGVVVSVNVGLPQDVAWQGRTVRTAVWKTPAMGRIMARRLNLDGDGQGDLRGHGGEQRALLIYQLDSYRYWANYLKRSDFVPGISARTSQWKVSPITRSALEIASKSAARLSRSASHATRATGSESG